MAKRTLHHMMKPLPRQCSALGMAVMAMIAATPVTASMPVSLRLTLVSADRHDEALNRAFVAVLSDYEAFLIAGHPVPMRHDAVALCAGMENKDGCVRTVIVSQPADQEQPPVVVVATRVGTNSYRWQCYGVGDRPWSAKRQDVTIDLKQALFAAPKVRFEARHQAIECIMAAASEANGRVRVAQD